MGQAAHVSTRRMEARLGKPWPRSQIWPIAFMCTSCELRMGLIGFKFFNGCWGGRGRAQKKNISWQVKHYMKFEFQHP